MPIMPKTYAYDRLQRCNSFIQDSDGSTHNAIATPSAGNSANTRFFGNGIERKFVVKRPKYFNKYGPYDDSTIKRIDLAFENEYRREQEVWNLVYPDNKADLFTAGGLRLVLPCLPGETLSVSLSQHPLTRCQQLLSVAYAVQRFNHLGFKYSDFNLDNVLIEQKSNGDFQAYLIDFNNTLSIYDAGGNQELALLNMLTPDYNFRTAYETIEALIEGLKSKINSLTMTKTHFASLFMHQPENTSNQAAKPYSYTESSHEGVPVFSQAS
jgi:hypothetical protein